MLRLQLSSLHVRRVPFVGGVAREIDEERGIDHMISNDRSALSKWNYDWLIVDEGVRSP
jgi:hypothetical protein